ncbi:hypothetical protein DPMN_096107 [Dreissena polymorpha]|uniref:Uncharacterized protein n=1 Tax=Dreissena polymorpha TaxID=45954 RepID=A0A9D4L950_DREPO|nr:hypothetical protein DPMN_096107 [Dreissena polymorpha]
MLGYLIKGNVIARVRIFYQTCSCYHSKSGVYGHRPKPVQSPFQVDDTHKANRNANSNVFRLVEAYRTYGHRKATIDPLGLQQVMLDQAELAPERYGLSPSSQQTIDVAGLFYSATGNQMMTVDELIVRLEKEYCDTIGAEFQHLQSEAEREWFAKAFEKKNDVSISNHRKIDLANLMLKCQAFDHFLAAKFTTLKRGR